MSKTTAEKTLGFLRDEFQRFGSIFPNFQVAIYYAELPENAWQAFVGQQALWSRSAEWQEWRVMWDNCAAVRFYGDATGLPTFEALAVSADLALERLVLPRGLPGEGTERWLAQLHLTGAGYPTPLLWLEETDTLYYDHDAKSWEQLQQSELPCNAFTSSAGLLTLILNPDQALLIDDSFDDDAIPIIATADASQHRDAIETPPVQGPFVFYPTGDYVWRIVFTSADDRKEDRSIVDATGLRQCWQVMKAQGKSVPIDDISVPKKQRWKGPIPPPSTKTAERTLDRTGKERIWNHVRYLQDQLDIAIATGNVEKEAEVQDALNLVMKRLNKDTGLKGKPRPLASSPARKARNRVGMSTSRAMNKCEEQGLPLFAEHLRKWLVIEHDACRYCPPGQPPPWLFDAPSPDAH